MILNYLSINPNKHKPLWKILPIGGYTEVLRFTKNADTYLLNRRIGQYAFLDGDVIQVKQELGRKGNNRTEAETKLWELFNELDSKTKYLKITPELGVWEWISGNMQDAEMRINQRFPDTYINVNQLLYNCNINFPNQAGNLRNDAKSRIAWLSSEISTQTNEDKKRIKQHLFSSYCEAYYSIQENKNELNQLFGPIFRHNIN